MGKKTNEENFKKYLERLSELQRNGDLVPSPDLPTDKLMEHLVEEGNKLLAEEDKNKKNNTVARPDETQKLTRALALSSKNPYVRARIMILEKMPLWRKKEIAEMERTGNIHNVHYEEFVHEVAKLGDTLT